MYLRRTPGLHNIKSDIIRDISYIDQDYTVYPAPNFFTEEIHVKKLADRLYHPNSVRNRPHRALCIHLPPNNSPSLYCNTPQLKHNESAHIDRYTDYLLKEIRLIKKAFQNTVALEQIYLEGGTTTLPSQSQLRRLIDAIGQNFSLRKNLLFRTTIALPLADHHSINKLCELGANDLTLCLKDNNLPRQSTGPRKLANTPNENKTQEVVAAARKAGFDIIRIKLLYGQEKQNEGHWGDTLDIVVAAQPDLINLQCGPSASVAEKANNTRLTTAFSLIEEQFDSRLYSIRHLINAGYIHIGMNLFARQDNYLVTAQRQGRLHYDLLGYSILPDYDVIAVGISAIGKSGSALYQNHSELLHYYNQLDQNKLPIMRGLELSPDDLLRRSVMYALICHSVISFESAETYFPIDFKQYFAHELSVLTAYEKAGLVTINEEEIAVTPTGKLFVGNICQVFDQYLRNN